MECTFLVILNFNVNINILNLCYKDIRTPLKDLEFNKNSYLYKLNHTNTFNAKLIFNQFCKIYSKSLKFLKFENSAFKQILFGPISFYEL